MNWKFLPDLPSKNILSTLPDLRDVGKLLLGLMIVFFGMPSIDFPLAKSLARC